MHIIPKACVKNGFAESCTHSWGCLCFPGLLFQQVDIKYLEVLWQHAWGACIHLPSLSCVPSKEKERKEQLLLCTLRVNTDCTSLHGHTKAKEWYIFSMHCSIVAIPIFHYRFSSHIAFIYISSFLYQWIV